MKSICDRFWLRIMHAAYQLKSQKSLKISSGFLETCFREYTFLKMKRQIRKIAENFSKNIQSSVTHPLELGSHTS